MPKLSKRKQVIIRFLEFLIVGLVMGVTEDIIAIKLATDAEITMHVFVVAFWVAIPFAIFSELIVDAKVIRRKIRSILFKKSFSNKTK